MTVQKDHSTVKSVLEAFNPTEKHTPWLAKVQGRSLTFFRIVYQAGRENVSAVALSRCLNELPPTCGIGQGDFQVTAVISDQDVDVSALLQASSIQENQFDHATEQSQDPDLKALKLYLQQDTLTVNRK